MTGSEICDHWKFWKQTGFRNLQALGWKCPSGQRSKTEDV